MDKVRWGLLSTAHINRRLIPAIRASRRGSLEAVASRSPESAQAYAKHWEIPQAFGSYEDMLQSGAIDAVYIGLPNHLHAEWSIRALQAGVHVLCEKPFAITLEQVDVMIAASRANKRCLAEAFMYLHHPQTRIAADWVRSGRLGEITLVRSTFNFSLHEPQNVRMIPEYGGGSLWDVGVYPVSLSQFILGEPPAWVFGSQWLGSTQVDEIFGGQMGYSSGRLAQISCSFRTPSYALAEVFGTEGRLELRRPFLGMDDGRRHMTFYSPDGDKREVPVPKQELYSGEVEDMQAAILDGKPNALSLEETRKHILTVLALKESASSGQPVFVNESFTKP